MYIISWLVCFLGLFCRWFVASAGPQLIQVIGPGLHHLRSLGEVLGVVVCRTYRIFFPVCKLCLNDIRAEALLVKERTCHCPESMDAELFLSVPYATQSVEQAHVSDDSCSGLRGGEEEFSTSSPCVKLFEQVFHLSRTHFIINGQFL